MNKIYISIIVLLLIVIISGSSYYIINNKHNNIIGNGFFMNTVESAQSSITPNNSIVQPKVNNSMTILLTHTFAHSTGLSFRLKTNNLPGKKTLGLAYTCIKVIKNDKILTFKVNFSCEK